MARHKSGGDRLIRLSLLLVALSAISVLAIITIFILNRACPLWPNMALKIFFLARIGFHQNKASVCCP